MIILGLNGGLDFPYENEFNLPLAEFHDAAAALVVDGKVVSAIEEERLNRIKHSNKTSLFFAAKFVLEDYGISIREVDKVCYYSTEERCNEMLKMIDRRNFVPIRTRITQKINDIFQCDFDEKKLYFIHHHLAHAMSTYVMSGFDESLILSMDGYGDNISVMVLKAENGNLEVIDTMGVQDSLGLFYARLIAYLGFGSFDEYKVMGLAPYGNPAAFRDMFKAFYKLLPMGRFKINWKFFHLINDLEGIPRKRNEPFSQIHKDLAAAIQEALETIVFHLLDYYKEKFNPSKLCLAGGVAQNCTLNGKILYSGMFGDVFVQPASYDAGTAVGAALYAYYQDNHNHKKFKYNPEPRLEHVYWGTAVGTNDEILKKLKWWDRFVDYKKIDYITGKTAALLADGAVIGWVQGRSEFGPRALGNRSILADPRPPGNKDIINAMVKKREAFRPFAPSVLEEYVEAFYVIPGRYKKFPFMTFVLQVKKDKQDILGAVTHVDGTARIQTVSRKTNKEYWQLIEEFRKITSIPILLNTSFNNNVEPIVNSFEDAIVCYLTTKLDYLVVGDYLIKKKKFDRSSYLELVPSLPLHIHLSHTKKPISRDRYVNIYNVRDNFLKLRNTISADDPSLLSKLSFGIIKANVSGDLFNVLTQVDGKKSFKELLNHRNFPDNNGRESLIEEILNLWAMRLIQMKPQNNQ
jgi:carbamoyltransferase